MTKSNKRNIPALFYGLVLSPVETIKLLIKEKENHYIGTALFTLFIAGVFKILANSIVLRNKSVINFLFGMGAIPYFGNFIGNIFLLIALWFFFIFFILYKSQVKNLKQKNYPLLLFKLMAFSYYPLFFLPAFSLLSLIINFHTPDTLYMIFSFFIKIWIAVLQIIIIKTLFNLKTFGAFILYLIPIIIYYAFIFFKLINLIINFAIKFI